jgi:hypothetical protein
MLDWLRYRYAYNRLRRQHRKERAVLPLHLKTEAHDEADDQTAEVDEEALKQMRRRLDSLFILETDYLVSTALKRHIAIPPMTFRKGEPNAKWRPSRHTPDMILNVDGRRELYLAIRADRRERLEMLRSWTATVITGLTGLIGVLIGLAAVILGKR